MLNLFSEIIRTGIDFVDVGCSGELDMKWRSLFPLLNFTGFDPNGAEVARLNGLPTSFRQTRYLPYAVHGRPGKAVLFHTRSPGCYSVLMPRQVWLNRFAYHDLFAVTGSEEIDCVTLDDLVDQHGLRADILKLDTQGLELPILKSSAMLLREAICVETETGFVENYLGESVSSDVDSFMRQAGYLLFDMAIHREGRRNPLGRYSRHQPLWCECLWLKDYLAATSWGIQVPTPTRIQALKAIVICRVLGFHDYGYELAVFFHGQGLVTADEMNRLADKRLWMNHPKMAELPPLVGRLARYLPRRWIRWIHDHQSTFLPAP